MNISYWEKETFFNRIDLLIVGSGIVGINVALAYKKLFPKSKVVILERGILPLGASTKNAGFACIGSASELLSDLENRNEAAVFNLVNDRKVGLGLLRKLLGDKAIDYQEFGGFELFNDNDSFEKCNDKLVYLNNHLSAITGNKNTYTIADDLIKKFGFKGVAHLLKNNFEGQIDTGKMMVKLLQLAIKKGIVILNGVEVKSIESINVEHAAVILHDNDVIKANKVLICTNGFAKKLLPTLDIVPGRAQVLITSEIENLKIKGAFHFDSGYYYFRNINNRVLFGGGRNLDFTGETTTAFGTTPLIQQKLIDMLQHIILPNQPFEIEQTWSGIMGLGESKQPIIEQVKSNVYCAVRMGGMGVAIGTLVGKKAADLITKN
jgi:hypothetical protein